MSSNKTNTVYVFKTSIHSKKQLKFLKPHLDRILPDKKWNVDLDDCDKILRIESLQPLTAKVIHELKRHDVFCEELD